MTGMFDIYSGGGSIGTVKVSREGLYYVFDCQCRLQKKEICKVFVDCGEKKIALGTLVPQGDSFVLRTKLPCKHFVDSNWHFSTNVNEGEFIPIQENTPFLHLKDLKNAVFQIRNGVRGIVIRQE